MSFRFEKGDSVQVGETFYGIVESANTGLTLLSLDGKTQQTIQHDAFFKLYFEKTLRVHRGMLGALPECVVANLHSPIEAFAVRWQDEALVRLDYVQICDRVFSPAKTNRRGRFPKRPEGYARISRLVAGLRRRREAQRTGRPALTLGREDFCGSTVRDWHVRWTRSGQNVAALVPGHESKGTTGFRLEPEVVAVIGRRIDQNYLTMERPDATVVHDLVGADVEDMNLGRAAQGVEQLAVPTYDTFLRYIERFVEPFDKVRRREGSKVAGQKFRHVRRAPKPVRPLQVVEIDHTHFNLVLVDEKGVPSRGDGRKVDKPETYTVWLTLARCRLTKMVWGFHFSRDRPSWTSVMACMRMGVMPKDLTGVTVRSPWPVFGVPEVLVMDNGPEFHSRSLRAAAGQLRTEPMYMPRGRPHLKGGIERTIGIVSRDFLTNMPGRLFRDRRERGDYDSHGRAAVTLPKLNELFTTYIVDVLHNASMGALLGKTPLQAWQDAQGFEVRLPPNPDDLDVILSLAIDRTVTSVGVTFMGLNYHSPDLHGLRKRVGHMGQKLMVKVDPLDLGRVLVLDEGDGKRKPVWVEAECSYPELADGVSLAEWRETVALGRQHVAAGQRIALSVLRDARRRLAEEAKRLGKKPRKPVQADIDWFRKHVDEPTFDVAPEEGRDPNGLFEEEQRRKRGRPPKDPSERKPPRRVGQGTTAEAAPDHQHAPVEGDAADEGQAAETPVTNETDEAEPTTPPADATAHEIVTSDAPPTGGPDATDDAEGPDLARYEDPDNWDDD